MTSRSDDRELDEETQDERAQDEQNDPALAEFLTDMTDWGVDGVAVIVVLLAVVGILARGLATIGLLLPGQFGIVVVAVILAALCVLQLTGVLVAFVRAGSGRHGAAWQMGNLVLVLMSLGLYVETFSAVSACLWRGSGEDVGPWGGLWNAESFYWWHVVRSIPLLDITGTLHWREPAYGVAHTPAGLVLAFKVIVILPLLQAAVSGYRLAIERWTSNGESLRYQQHAWERRQSGLFGVGRVVVAAVVVVYGVTWLAARVFSGDSAFTVWWTRTALPAIHVGGSRWLVAAPLIVLMIVGLFVLYRVVSAARDGVYFLSSGWSWWGTASVITVGIAALYGMILWDAGLLLTLARVELGVSLPDTTGLQAVVQALSWQVAHMLPGLDITGTLHWTAPVALDGGAISWIVLALKLFFVGLIVFLAIPMVRAGGIWMRYGPVLDAWRAMRNSTLTFAFPEAGLWKDFDRERNALQWAARGLAARPRYAQLIPPVQALHDALPETGTPSVSPSTRVEIAAALTAFRQRVFEHFPGAAPIIEFPGWLKRDGE